VLTVAAAAKPRRQVAQTMITQRPLRCWLAAISGSLLPITGRKQQATHTWTHHAALRLLHSSEIPCCT
jgi:hypothetical protein